MKRQNLALVGVFGATGALGTAALAATGCPMLAVALSVFGVSLGALANLSTVSTYRAALVIAGFVSLFSAAWWLYGRSPERASASPSSRTRALFWVAAAVFVLVAAYPYALGAYSVVTCTE